MSFYIDCTIKHYRIKRFVLYLFLLNFILFLILENKV